LVRAVARAHGGNVTVRSEVDKGSEFELTLPGGQQALPVSSLVDAATSARMGDHEQGSARR